MKSSLHVPVSGSSESFERSLLILVAFALLALLIHMLVSTNYGLHRDAYLYLAEADHLAWGYVSIPPFTPFAIHLWEIIFGHSVFAVRLLPAVIGAVSILVIGQIVRELGGRAWALGLACLAYLVSPAFLRSNALLQPVAFDSLFWLLGTWAMVRLLRTGEPKWWLALGIIFGIGFLNKYSIVFPAFAFVIALSLTKQRKLFASRWLLYGVIAGLLIILPNLLWQYAHRWPVIHHMTELRDTQLVNVRLSDFLMMQLFMIFPAFPVFLAGLLYVFFDPEMQRYRVMGWTFIVLMAVIILLSGKFYYTLGIYPVFFAFGGLAVIRYTMRGLAWVRWALPFLMILLLLPGLPLSLPVLTYPAMLRYDRGLTKAGMDDVLRWEDGTVHPLPQDYADMTGWEDLAGIVDSTWRSLTPQEQQRTAIYAENYGQAGAIHYFGKTQHLPEPISFSDSFLLWAPDSISATTLVYVNDEATDIHELFHDVILAGKVTQPYAREYGTGVYLCRKPAHGFAAFYSAKVDSLKAAYTR